MGVFTYLYVKFFYFVAMTMVYSTLSLYILWGQEIDGVVVRSIPPALGFISALLIPNPNAGYSSIGRLRRLSQVDTTSKLPPVPKNGGRHGGAR